MTGSLAFIKLRMVRQEFISSFQTSFVQYFQFPEELFYFFNSHHKEKNEVQ